MGVEGGVSVVRENSWKATCSGSSDTMTVVCSGLSVFSSR